MVTIGKSQDKTVDFDMGIVGQVRSIADGFPCIKVRTVDLACKFFKRMAVSEI
jgi:hypothetical protein